MDPSSAYSRPDQGPRPPLPPTAGCRAAIYRRLRGRSFRCRRCSWTPRAASQPGRTAPPADRRRCRLPDSYAEEPVRVGGAEDTGCGADRGKDAHGDTEQSAQLLAPRPGPDIEEHGTRSVGRIGYMRFTCGKPGNQPAVDRADRQRARERCLAGTRTESRQSWSPKSRDRSPTR